MKIGTLVLAGDEMIMVFSSAEARRRPLRISDSERFLANSESGFR